MMTGFPGSHFCIKAFSETDLTEDLKKLDVLSSKIVMGARSFAGEEGR